MYYKPVREAYRAFVHNYSYNDLVGDGISSIQFQDNLYPVRKVVSRSNAKATGKWPSWKMGSVHYESENELLAFKLLDAFPHVLSYYPQPCRIRYVLDGEVHTHVPDILVFTQTGVEIWEVKPSYDALGLDVYKRTDFMSINLKKIGYTYHLVIAETLKDQIWFTNLDLVLKRGRESLDLRRREAIRQTFQSFKKLQWGSLNKGASGTFIHQNEICRLILEGKVLCDLSLPISDATVVRATDLFIGGQK